MIKSFSFNDKLSFNKFFFPLFIFSLVSGPLIPEILIFLLIINFIYKNNIRLLVSRNLKVIFIFLTLFYLYLNLNTFFFSFDSKISLKSTLPYIRLILFSFIIFKIFQNDNNKKIINIFVFSYLFLLIILLLDSILQLKTGENIFGNPYYSGRITSLFAEEQIMGSFVSKILPIILSFLCVLNSKNNRYYITFFLSISLILILLSSERIALVHYIFIVFFVLYIESKNLKIFFSSILVFLIVVLLALNFYAPGMNRIKDATLDQFKSSTTIMAPSYRHELHYITALYMFLDKPIFGNGIKSFRYKCSDYDNLIQDKIIIDKAIYAPYDGYAKELYLEKYGSEKLLKFEKKNKMDSILGEYKVYRPHPSFSKFNSKIDSKYNSSEIIKKNEFLFASNDYSTGCNTHPHNYFLQFLSELGSIGLIFYTIVFLYLLLRIFKIFIMKFSINKIPDVQKSIFIISGSILIELMPFIPSGNFFNNWLSMIFFLKLGSLLFFLDQFYNQKNNE